MLAPMMPRPMNPTCMIVFSSLVNLVRPLHQACTCLGLYGSRLRGEDVGACDIASTLCGQFALAQGPRAQGLRTPCNAGIASAFCSARRSAIDGETGKLLGV